MVAHNYEATVGSPKESVELWAVFLTILLYPRPTKKFARNFVLKTKFDSSQKIYSLVSRKL